MNALFLLHLSLSLALSRSFGFALSGNGLSVSPSQSSARFLRARGFRRIKANTSLYFSCRGGASASTSASASASVPASASASASASRLTSASRSSQSKSRSTTKSTSTSASASASTSTSTSASDLSLSDPTVHALLQSETRRQKTTLNLIASENYASPNILEALGSTLTNKYSEGQPGKRYYAGNEVVDSIESLCESRALEVYGLDPSEWGVTVQPYSGSPANFEVFNAVCECGDVIMGMDLPSGGHLTHGFQRTLKNGTIKPVSATSKYFTSKSYSVSASDGLIDYPQVLSLALKEKPRVIIAGPGSAYPRDVDYSVFRSACDSVGSLLMVDMAHVSGLVAGKHKGTSDPFLYADIVTSTTHKTLRGPRGGMIFARRELIDKIKQSVFPGMQGGPHNNNIAALAVAFSEASTPSFKEYISDVVENCRILCRIMTSKGFVLQTGGSDNHMLLWDVRDYPGGGDALQNLLEEVGITVNKNSIVGDTSALKPGGVRIGLAAITTRGISGTENMEKVASFLERAVHIAEAGTETGTENGTENGTETGNETGTETGTETEGDANSNDAAGRAKRTRELKEDVTTFVSRFPLPGE